MLVLGALLLFAPHPGVVRSIPRKAAPAAPVARFLVLYQPEPRGPGTETYALLTANLLGRFGRAEIRDLDRYRAGDDHPFAAVFVLPALGGAPVPQPLLADVRNAAKPIVWMQHGIQQLLSAPDFARAMGWRPTQGRPAHYMAVEYKGQAFTRDQRDRSIVNQPVVFAPQKAQVLARALGPDATRSPWAVRSGNFTYLVEAPFAYADEDDRYLVFADLLFRILAPSTPERHRALVRIEDIGPEADPARIRRLADLLHAEGAPFSMAVYDSYRDPLGRFNRGKPLAFELRDRLRLVEALNYACARGGVLVAHGHTHQFDKTPNPYAAVSGGDYEFFRASLDQGRSFVLNGPLPDDTVAHWRRRLADIDRGWASAGLPATAFFTTPHYAASLSAYQALRERFPVRYERVTYFPGEGAGRDPDYASPPFDQLFPFETVDARGDFIVPENLGYISSRWAAGPFGRRPSDLVASARRNLAVRDGYASFFYHWYEDPEQLRGIVRSLKSLGYTFVSPVRVAEDAPASIRPELPVHLPTTLQRFSRRLRIGGERCSAN